MRNVISWYALYDLLCVEVGTLTSWFRPSIFGYILFIKIKTSIHQMCNMIKVCVNVEFGLIWNGTILLISIANYYNRNQPREHAVEIFTAGRDRLLIDLNLCVVYTFPYVSGSSRKWKLFALRSAVFETLLQLCEGLLHVRYAFLLLSRQLPFPTIYFSHHRYVPLKTITRMHWSFWRYYSLCSACESKMLHFIAEITWEQISSILSLTLHSFSLNTYLFTLSYYLGFRFVL